MAQITTLFWDVGGVLLTNGWDKASRQKACATRTPATAAAAAIALIAAEARVHALLWPCINIRPAGIARRCGKFLITAHRAADLYASF